jgi:hypothetical protein
MTMTKQHFELIAQVIRWNREDFKSNTAHARFAATVADTLSTTNHNFDRRRFIMAAMPEAWVGTKHETAWERVA